MQEYSQYEEPLRRLLKEFGSPSTKPNPEYPFWRLRHDNVWKVEFDPSHPPELNASGDVKSIERLRQPDFKGGFLPEVEEALHEDPSLVKELAEEIISAHFEESMAPDILAAVGLEFGLNDIQERRYRSPSFREDVLRAYDRRCAICGWEIRLGSESLGLEAAHVKWSSCGGPDQVDNGIAMCALHHKAFDRGGIGVGLDLTIRISKALTGSVGVEEMFRGLRGKKIKGPLQDVDKPREEFLHWHDKEVFRNPSL